MPVIIDSTRPGTVIERRANRVRGWSFAGPLPTYSFTEQWETACIAPCQMRLDTNAIYQVSGGTVSSSGKFTLAPGKPPLHVHVDAGSSFFHTVGIVTVGVGVATLLLGAYVALAAADETDPMTEDGERKAGLFLGGLGLIMAGVGLPLWLTSTSTVSGGVEPL